VSEFCEVFIIRVRLAKFAQEFAFFKKYADQNIKRGADINCERVLRGSRCEPEKKQTERVQRMPHNFIKAMHNQCARFFLLEQLAQTDERKRVGLQEGDSQQNDRDQLPAINCPPNMTQFHGDGT